MVTEKEFSEYECIIKRLDDRQSSKILWRNYKKDTIYELRCLHSFSKEAKFDKYIFDLIRRGCIDLRYKKTIK